MRSGYIRHTRAMMDDIVCLQNNLNHKAIPLNVILSKEQGDASEESRRRTAYKTLKLPL